MLEYQIRSDNMGKDIVFDTIPTSFYKEKIEKGCSAQCYKTEDGRVYKEFFAGVNYLEYLRVLSEYKSPSFVFPEEFVFKNNEPKLENFTGYLMTYIDGMRFDKLSDAIKIRNLIESLRPLEKEIMKLSQYGITTVDLNAGNLILDKNNIIHVIDTDLYEINFDGDIYGDIFKENIKELASTVISTILLNSSGYDKEIQNEIFKCGAYGRISTSTLLSNVLGIIESRYGSLETLGEFQMCLTYEKNKK